MFLARPRRRSPSPALPPRQAEGAPSAARPGCSAGTARVTIHDRRPSGIRTAAQDCLRPRWLKILFDGFQWLEPGQARRPGPRPHAERPRSQPRDGDEHDEQRDPDNRHGDCVSKGRNGGSRAPQPRRRARGRVWGILNESEATASWEPHRAQVRLGAAVTHCALEAATVEPFGRDGAGGARESRSRPC